MSETAAPPAPPLTKKDEPILEVKAVEDVLAQIVADPRCNKANCHGRGYIGIIMNKDGSQTVLLCNCAKYGETEFVSTVRHMEVFIMKIAQSVDLQYQQVLKGMQSMENHRRVSEDLQYEHLKTIENMTFTGRLKKLFGKKPAVPVKTIELAESGK